MARTASIPLLDLKAQYASIRDEVRSALDRVIESQQFILGPEVEEFERRDRELAVEEALGLRRGARLRGTAETCRSCRFECR